VVVFKDHAASFSEFGFNLTAGPLPMQEN